MTFIPSPAARGWLAFALLVGIAVAIYCLGLHGPFIFDDYPNIVDNPGVRLKDGSLSSLARGSLASPASDFKRPLSSLSFGLNYLATGGAPAPMKITNIVIHVLNGVLVFLFARMLLTRAGDNSPRARNPYLVAALLAGFWLLLPINLTSVLYVVQRMESLANLFVMFGLVAYTQARARMQESADRRWPILALTSIGASTVAGLLAKETAVMLPMYAFVVDACLFRFRSRRRDAEALALDRRVVSAFALLLFLPLMIGLYWLLPGLLHPQGWATREFTLGTRLLTELRVVVSYIGWTLVPTAGALSFYHDDIVVSTGFFTPWTTAAAAFALVALGVVAFIARHRFPLVTLGILLYASCHALTGTILPLELVYEHRNYFASIGLLIAVVPLLAAGADSVRWPTVRYALLAALMVLSTLQLVQTARAWNDPVSLARELAARAPRSPRAQYELGRTYIIMSRYSPTSPFTPLVYDPLEQAIPLPGSSILAEQALIFFNARMHRPVKDAWWDSLTAKLGRNKVTVQDESALSSLAECLRIGSCDLPKKRVLMAFMAALNHPNPSARLLIMYADFAWNSLDDRELGLRAAQDAVQSRPGEPAYRVTLARMLTALGRIPEAEAQRGALAGMNVGGALDDDIDSLDTLISSQTVPPPAATPSAR
jgi:protein O-mannosyl-transferase